MANMLRGERRQQKSSRRWYKHHLHNNRKAMALVQEQETMRLAGAKPKGRR